MLPWVPDGLRDERSAPPLRRRLRRLDERKEQWMETVLPVLALGTGVGIVGLIVIVIIIILLIRLL